MSFFDKASQFLGFKVDKGIERSVPIFLQSTPWGLDDDYRDLAQGAYGRNSIVHAAVREISASLSMAPLQVLDSKGQPADVHPLLDLLENPTPFHTTEELMETIVIHRILSGNAYLLKVRAGKKSNKIKELWPLRPDRVKVQVDSNSYISSYIYEIDGNQFRIDPKDIIHIKYVDPINMFIGQSPLRSLLKDIDADNESVNFTRSTLKNGGMPSGVLSVENPLSKHERDRIRQQWLESYGGENKGTLAILEGGVSYDTLSMSTKDLALVEVNDMTRKRILAVLGVPGILLGFDSATYANYGEARRSFWEETVVSWQREIAAKLERDPELNPTRLQFKFDNENVPAMREVRDSSRAATITTFQSGLITIEEARAELGYSTDKADFESLLPKEPEPTGPKKEDIDELKKSIESEFSTKLSSLEDQNKDLTKKIESEEGDTESLLSYLSGNVEQKDNQGLDLLSRSLGKLSVADQYFDRFRHWAKKELKRNAEQILSLLDQETKDFGPAEGEKIIKKVKELEEIQRLHATETLEPLMKGFIAQGVDTIMKSEFEGIDLLDETIIDSISTAQKDRLAKSFVNTTTGDVIARLEKGLEEGQSLGEIKSSIKEVLTGKNASNRAELIARTETINTANEAARMSYKKLGVKQMRWLAAGDACPYCQGLNGKVVSVDEPFLEQGEFYQPKGASRALNTTYKTMSTPPCHPGCRCTIIPE